MPYLNLRPAAKELLNERNTMCKELEDELETADAPALALVQHLSRMGAAKCDIPVETTRPDGKTDHWKVTVEYVD